MLISNQTNRTVTARVLRKLSPEEQKTAAELVVEPIEPVEPVDEDGPMPGNQVGEDEDRKLRYQVVPCALAESVITQLIGEGWVPIGHPFVISGQAQQAMWLPVDFGAEIQKAYQEGRDDRIEDVAEVMVYLIDETSAEDDPTIWDFNPDTGISTISSAKLKTFVEHMVRADEATFSKSYDVPPEPIREAIDKAWNDESDTETKKGLAGSQEPGD